MSDYIPPYPPRHAHEISPWRRIAMARENLLSAFEDGLYELDFVTRKIGFKHFFLCNSPETIQAAFGTAASTFERKGPTQRQMLRPILGDGLFVSEAETWRKRRRMVAPVIHLNRLSEFAPFMTEAALEMAGRWGEKQDGATTDVLRDMAQLTAEIICRTIFGGALGRERGRDVVESFSAFQRSVSQVDIPSLFGLPDWFPRFRTPAEFRAIRGVHRVVDSVIADYRKRPDGGGAIGKLMDARDETTGEKLDAKALRNEAVVIFLAGHETTASTLAFALYILSQATDAEARLHVELDAVLGDRAPTLADVPKLPFTQAIIEETLRLYPPIPILGREAMVDDKIAGHKIPKGSLLFVVPWLVHRNRKLWDKPDHFIPERFLPGNPAPSKWTYLPFSMGPRICAGMAFGLTEAILCLATLAQQFKLRLSEGHKMEPICRVSLRPGEELPMTLHRRRPPPKPGDAPSPTALKCPVAHA